MNQVADRKPVYASDVIDFAKFSEESQLVLKLLEERLISDSLVDEESEKIETALSNFALSYMRPREISGQDLYKMRCAYILIEKKQKGALDSVSGDAAQAFLRQFPYIKDYS